MERALTSDELVKQGRDEGSYVYMLGFLVGLANVDSNTPICKGDVLPESTIERLRRQNKFF